MLVGQRFHCAVGQILHPRLERVGAMHQVAGLDVQPSQRLTDRGTGIESIRNRFLFGDNAFQLARPH